MACTLCCADDSRAVHTNEMWAGIWNSACCHRACSPCLEQWIDKCLPLCRAWQVMRIPCFAPGCQKMLPQKLVIASSADARVLAEAIDRRRGCDELRPCPICGEKCCPLE